MKRHLLKIVVGGFIVFLTLPLIFDGDGADSAVAKKAVDSAAQTQDAEVVLPVVQQALPFRSENVLSKYAGRFKRFYVNPTESKQKISQEIQQEQNGFVYASADTIGAARASYGKAATGEDEAYVKEYFSDAEAKDSPLANYGALSADGTKQKVHDNAPVKGLYESSAVDSYEARVKAKEVYSNVMNRVDTATGTATEEEEVEPAPATALSAKHAVYAKPAEDRESANNESKYIGIASKGSSKPSSVSSGSLSGGFGGGGVSAKEAGSSSSGVNMGNFEVAAQNVEGKVEKVAPEGGVSKSFTVVSNGRGGVQKPYNPAAPNQPQKPGIQPNNPSNPNNPNNPNTTDQGGNESDPHGGHNHHNTAATFKLEDWPVLDLTVRECKGPKLSLLDNKKDEAESESGTQKGQGQQAVAQDTSAPKEANKQELGHAADAVDPTCAQNLPKFGEDVSKYKLLVEAGKMPDGKRAVYTDASLAGMPSIIQGMGGVVYNSGKEVDPKNMPGIVSLSDEEYWKLASSKDVVNLASSEDVKNRLPNSTVPINANQFKTITGLKEVISSASKLVLTKEEQEAAAKKAAQEKVVNNKKEVVKQTKEAVEKVNGK